MPSSTMLGFKSYPGAAPIFSGIEMINMMRKRRARYAYNPSPSIAEQFDILAARLNGSQWLFTIPLPSLRQIRSTVSPFS